MRTEHSYSQLFDICSEVLRRWWLPCGLMLVFGALALVWGLRTEKVYRVEAVLAPVSADGADSAFQQLTSQFAGLSAMLGINLGATGHNEDVAIATLKSRQFTADFLHKEKLLPVIFASQWDESRQQWRESLFHRTPTLAHAVDVFDRKIRAVRQDRKTKLVHLIIEWKDPVLAAEWANKMVQKVNELMRSRAIAEAQQSIRYLSEEAQKSDLVGVQQAAYGLIQSQLNRVTLAKVRDEYAFQVVDPATPPDRWDYVRPRLGLIVPLGAGLGLLTGVLIVLLRARVAHNV